MNTRERARLRMKKASQMSKAERISFWQRLGTQAIFEATDELRLIYCEEHGINPKLDKNVAVFHRGPKLHVNDPSDTVSIKRSQ